jgi:hypothetical protein
VYVTPAPPQEMEHDLPDVLVKLAGRTQDSPGVCYLFRFAALHGRPLDNWSDGRPRTGLDNAGAWWDSTYHSRFDRVHLIDQYLMPKNVGANDVVVCRAHHLVSKRELVQYLTSASQKGVNLIFAEIPPAFALRLYNYLYILAKEIDFFFQ